MKIGFDAKRAFYNNRGLGSYSRSLIEALVTLKPENEYHLYSPKYKNSAVFPQFNDADNLTIHHQNHFSNSYWRTFQMGHQISNDDLNVYHGLSNELPYSKAFNTKYVVTIHDLIFLKHPQFYPWIDRSIYRWKVGNALKNADHVICVSENTRKDVLAYFNLPETKLSVIHPMCSSIFYAKFDEREKAQVITKYQLPEQFILSVGAGGSNKNLVTLYRALSLLPDSYHLVVIGHRKQNPEIANSLKSRIHFLGYLPEKDLAIVYNLTSITAFISLYEGFGLPVVESLAAGTPVVASGISGIPEALGPGGLLVEPTDHKKIAESIEAMVEDYKYNHQLSESGHQHSLQFRPVGKAQEVSDLYQSLFN